MHYYCWAVVKKDEAEKNLNAAVKAVMEDYGKGRIWDWYQIGGRWTGELSGYKPEDDLVNIERCDLCHGTGFRKDGIADDPTYTCNGCGTYDEKAKRWAHGKYGPGKRLKWPTDFAPHAGDVVPLEEALRILKDAKYAPCVVFSDGGSFQKELWNGFEHLKTPDFDAKLIEELKKEWYKDSVVIVIDIHN